MSKWYKSDFKGVRYRKHPTRKHGVKFDRYFVITYKWHGKTITEALGWESEGAKASDAFDSLRELKRNQKNGDGPCTLTEKRQASEDQKKAKAKMRAVEQQQTFKNFFDDIFLPDAKTRWKPQTFKKAEQHVKNWIHPVTGDLPMRELTLLQANQIKANLNDADRSPRHTQYVFRTFSMVWNAALDHGFVNAPCPTKSASFRLPKVDNERQRYLTLEEETILLKTVKARSQKAHDMALVSLDSGLRFGEVANLTWGCLDLDGGTIRVLDTKSGRDRDVPMTERLLDHFKSLTAGNSGELVYPGRKGKPLTEASSSFRTAIKDVKINDNITNKKLLASFHTLRHTYASRLVQSGADLYRVQRLLGHSTPIMTQRYSKLADDDLRNAVKSMDRIGNLHRLWNSMAVYLPMKQELKIQDTNGNVIQLRKKEA